MMKRTTTLTQRLLCAAALLAGGGLATQAVADVRLNAHRVSLDYLTQFATLAPGQALAAGDTAMWSTGNPAVAIVDAQGHVRAVAGGSTYVRLTTGSGAADSCLVTVENGLTTLVSTADTYIEGGKSKTTNYGTRGNMVVKFSNGKTSTQYDRTALVKFPLPATLPAQASVKVSLYIASQNTGATKSTVSVWATQTDWNETEATADNQPDSTQSIASGIAVPALSTANLNGNLIEFDVTDYVRQQIEAGATEVSFLLTQPKNFDSKQDFNLATKENGNITYRPRMVIQDESTVSVSLLSDSIALDYARPYAQLAVRVVPASARAKVKATYTADDPTIVAVGDGGQLFALKGGATKVKVSAPNARNIEATVTVENDLQVVPISGDVFVQNGTANAGKNFNNDNRLVVKFDGVGYDRKTFVRMALPAITLPADYSREVQAKLVMNLQGLNTTATQTPVAINVVPSTWSETTLTAATAPDVDERFATTVVSLPADASLTDFDRSHLDGNISDLVTQAIEGGMTELSLRIYQTERSATGKHDFILTPHEVANAAKRPYLVMRVVDAGELSFDAAAAGQALRYDHLQAAGGNDGNWSPTGRDEATGVAGTGVYAAAQCVRVDAGGALTLPTTQGEAGYVVARVGNADGSHAFATRTLPYTGTTGALQLANNGKEPLFVDDVANYVSTRRARAIKQAQYVMLSGDYTEAQADTLIALLESNPALMSVDFNRVTSFPAGRTLALQQPNAVIYDDSARLADSVNVVRRGVCRRLAITAGHDFLPAYPFTATSVAYDAQLATGQGRVNAVTLPFSVSVARVEGLDSAYNLVEFDADRQVMNVAEDSVVTACRPMLLKASTAQPFAHLQQVDAYVPATTGLSVALQNMRFGGTVQNLTTLPAADDEQPFEIKDSTFVQSQATRLAAFGALLYVNADSPVFDLTTLPLRTVTGTVVGIDRATTSAAPAGRVNVYTIDGVLVRRGATAARATQGLRPGLYIVGGRKQLVP